MHAYRCTRSTAWSSVAGFHHGSICTNNTKWSALTSHQIKESGKDHVNFVSSGQVQSKTTSFQRYQEHFYQLNTKQARCKHMSIKEEGSGFRPDYCRTKWLLLHDWVLSLTRPIEQTECSHASTSPDTTAPESINGPGVRENKFA